MSDHIGYVVKLDLCTFKWDITVSLACRNAVVKILGIYRLYIDIDEPTWCACNMIISPGLLKLSQYFENHVGYTTTRKQN